MTSREEDLAVRFQRVEEERQNLRTILKRSNEHMTKLQQQIRYLNSVICQQDLMIDDLKRNLAQYEKRSIATESEKMKAIVLTDDQPQPLNVGTFLKNKLANAKFAKGLIRRTKKVTKQH